MKRKGWYRSYAVYILLFTLAIVLRLPYLMQYPVFRFDELGENLRAYAIVEFGARPLTNNAPFIGALYNYLAAGAYALINSIVAFRLLVALANALTVPLLYAISLKLTGSRKTSLLAAALLAFSPMHILVSSHVAWSASLMPFFLTAALYAVLKALESGGKSCWLAAGVCMGLSLQSHPSVLASYAGLLPALHMYLGEGFTRDLLRKFRYLLLGFLAGYVNMVIYNIVVPLGSLTFMFRAKWTGLSGGLTIPTYIKRVSFLAVEYTSGLTSGVPMITLPHLLTSAIFYIFIAVIAVTVVTGVIRSKLARALLVCLAISLLILAVGTKGVMTLNPFGFAWGPHYLQQLLPLTYLLIAESIRTLWSHALRCFRKYRLTLLAILIIAGFVLAWPFMNLLGVYKFMSTHKYTNEVFLGTIEGIRTVYGSDVPLFINIGRRDQVLWMLYLLAVLEGLHPEPDVRVVKEAGMRSPTSSLREFIDGLKPGTKAVIITKPDKNVLEFLKKYLLVKCFKIDYINVVKVRPNILLYAVIAVS